MLIIAACSSWEKNATPQDLFDELTAKGFIVARGDKRGVLMVVDKNGLYVSLERASGLGKKAFSDRMQTANTSKLPSLARPGRRATSP